MSAITKGLLLATALQVLDLLTFPMAVEAYGSHGESNTLMEIIYEGTGMLGVALVKGSLVAAAFYAALRLPKGQDGVRPLRALFIFGVGVIGLLGTITNLLVAVMYG